MIIRAEKIASLLFALFFAYFLKSTILGYATEPKVIGGIDFDQLIPQVIPWTPIYFPLLLSAAFGYWIWPTKSYPSLSRKMAAGSFAIIRVTFVTLFISILCTGFGAFYLTFPQLMKSEILPALATTFIAALQGTAIMSLFHGIAFIAFGVFFGCLIVLVAHVASKCLILPSTGSLDERVRTDISPLPTLLRFSTEWSWPSLIAGLIAVTIALSGFGSAGLPIIILWAAYLLPWGILWIALGTVIGFVSRHWAWCVAVSLPIGYISSTTHEKLQGVLASQSIDFPPVLLATSLGFSLARKFLHPRAPRAAELRCTRIVN
ncbi:hypothetical protein [Bradyrhizobium sp. LMTR 3]|uniref:hypothetical protein n=1 Tax=Bradyrhizobium sp. LMTR 3 TaxID=189873 RepID=UPI0008109D4E|nr:hypothetical protein [Bradyrhizobium sp. LMTR 3]OCK61257.1 hypothetical protein LMTR3_23885 [Bradyrhizobium sp. LMTR 3]